MGVEIAHYMSATKGGLWQTNTGLGKRVVPRLRESRLLTSSGRGARVHEFCTALYTFYI